LRLDALVGDQDFSVRQREEDGRGTAIIADLALSGLQYQWLAVRVATRVQLGVLAAFGGSNAADISPF
jgi:hypothetical protein